MIATLARSGSNSWSLGDKRYFDAWGDVEQGTGTGQPSQRYCANLGHVQDDESDLIYMRARYYEPGVGRFVSEDPARDGANWVIYADNNPVGNVDSGGTLVEPVTATAFLAVAQALGSAASYYLTFFAVVEYLQAMHPAFNPTPDWIGALLGIPVALAGAFLTRPANFGFAMKPSTLARHALRYGGVGAILGTVFGAYAARVAFELFYIENFESFGGDNG